jgi:UDP-glucose 4-epimerase
MATKVLVTGSTGFIGQNLTRQLARDGYEVHGTRRRFSLLGKGNIPGVEMHSLDLHDYDKVRHLLENLRPDVIFHLAANPIVKDDEACPTQISYDNVLATHNLLAFAPNGCRFIFASSVTVYGKTLDIPGLTVSEDCEQYPTSVYAATKIASEALVNAYTNLGKVDGVNLRLIANVGPHSTHGLVHDIIRKLRSDSEHLNLLGSYPGSCKPFIHVDDTVSAMFWAAFSGMAKIGDAYNITSLRNSGQSSLRVDQVAQIVMNELGIYKELSWGGNLSNWRGDNPAVHICGRKAMLDGWQATTDSQVAIQLAVNAYRNVSSLS